MKTEVIVTTRELLKVSVDSATKIRDITIPVWIRSSARPTDWSAITEQQLIRSGADMWMSITEIRRSDLKKHTLQIRKWDTVAAKGHDYEWLACGFIPESCIMRIMPWDGKKLHTNPDTRIVRSIGSPDPWIFDQNTRMWRLDARLYRTACFLFVYGGNKRKALAKEVGDDDKPPAKRQKTKKASKVQKAELDDNPYASTSLPGTANTDNDGHCCSQCGQQKAAFRLEAEISGPLSYLDLASSAESPSSILQWE